MVDKRQSDIKEVIDVKDVKTFIEPRKLSSLPIFELLSAALRKVQNLEWLCTNYNKASDLCRSQTITTYTEGTKKVSIPQTIIRYTRRPTAWLFFVIPIFYENVPFTEKSFKEVTVSESVAHTSIVFENNYSLIASPQVTIDADRILSEADFKTATKLAKASLENDVTRLFAVQENSLRSILAELELI
eukprot:TRINITY_DN4896_c0_g1_i1.p1 TRINITY_DN4896_c0_g1~~TRINITY_DN4896_c0_g1_i1.p1  ORF type:complete len:188 (+),score=20.82 TRINITY_DN4896_c0_g1_i1:561-1124(+)